IGRRSRTRRASMICMVLSRRYCGAGARTLSAGSETPGRSGRVCCRSRDVHRRPVAREKPPCASWWCRPWLGHPDLRGWEGRDESLAFPLVALRDGRIWFEGLTFEPRGDELTIYLAIRNRETGSLREETFRYRRHASVH